MEDRDKTVRAARVSSGLTQEQAAELICVSPPTTLRGKNSRSLLPLTSLKIFLQGSATAEKS